MKQLLLFLCCVYSCTSFALFDHDRAVAAAQQGDIKRATTILKDLVTKAPHNPSVLYDAGVASGKMGEHEQACAYFNAVAADKNAPSLLREQAYFNAGNCCVEQKKLEQAITQYESALSIKPDDKRAQHNLEVVKRMLQQQQQDNKKNKDNKKDDKKDQEKKDKQSEDQEKDQKDDDGDSQDDQDKSGKQDSKKPGDKDQQNKDEGKNERDKNKDTGQDKGQNKDKQDQGQKKNEQEKKDKQDSGKTEEQKKREEQDKKNKQKEDGRGEQDEKNKNSGNPSENGTNQMIQIDAKLAEILEGREKKDSDLNKKIIKATVGQELAGKHGQNCW